MPERPNPIFSTVLCITCQNESVTGFEGDVEAVCRLDAIANKRQNALGLEFGAIRT